MKGEFTVRIVEAYKNPIFVEIEAFYGVLYTHIMMLTVGLTVFVVL